jgi:TM2 domain-containing membrane protein YozV
LYQVGEYKTAALEYDRANLMAPNDTTFSKLLNCFRKTKDFDIVTKKMLLKYGPELYSAPKIVSESYANAIIHIENKDFSHKIKQFACFTDTEKYSYIFQNNLINGHWANANLLRKNLPNQYHENSDALDTILKKGLTQKTKKVPLALLSSAIIPGAGKAYVGNWKDGLISFILTAGTGFQAYRAFNRSGSNSIIGIGFLGISSGFYIGNLVGTVKETRKRNQIKHEKLTSKVTELLLTD